MKVHLCFDVQLGKDDGIEEIADKCREVGAVLAQSKRRLTVGLETQCRNELNGGFTVAMMYATLTNELYAMGHDVRVGTPRSLLAS